MATCKPENHKLGCYQIESSETVVNALTTAFTEIGIDPAGNRSALAEWIDCDCLNEMYQDTEDPLQIYTTIWDYPTLITPDEITIFEPPSDK